MMARNITVPFKGRIQKRKTYHLQIITFGLQRAAGPYSRVIHVGPALQWPRRTSAVTPIAVLNSCLGGLTAPNGHCGRFDCPFPA